MISFSYKTNFGQGIYWNLASFAILGLSAVIINFSIAQLYGPEILGTFNQVFSIYIILAQLGTIGIQLSALKHCSEYSSDEDVLRTILSTSLCIVAISSGFIVSLTAIITESFGKILDSPQVSIGTVYILPGIWFFSMNKVLLNTLNGLGQMRNFAVYRSLRVIFLTTGVLLSAHYSVEGEKLPLILSISEGSLFLILIFQLKKLLLPSSFRGISSWFLRHLLVGLKGFIGGVIFDINTRIDILMVGYFLPDKTVGVYSLAAMVVQGVTQLTNVLKYNIDAHLGRWIVTESKEALASIRQSIRKIYLVGAAIGTGTVLIYPLFLQAFVENPEFSDSWNLLLILMLGFIGGVGYRPFEMILYLAGYPGWQTMTRTAVVLTNIILNSILIPFAGNVGAAIATAITFLLAAIYLRTATKKIIGIQI